MEEWKDITGYEGFYQISNFGRVKSLKNRCKGGIFIHREKIMAAPVSSRGYRTVMLFNMYKYKSITVHRLVATYFCENPLNKRQINHIDGDKLNNTSDNLEWCTAKENIRHAISMGLFKGRNKSLKIL